MLSLRNRFGIPGVISVIALVFAMLGGAYAASNSSGGGKATASAKAKKGPRGPKGATGPAGPAGAQGPAGANGKDGSNGSNGSAGAQGSQGLPGKSVEVANYSGPECAGSEEGATVQIAGEPSTKKYVCDGVEGSPGAPGANGSPWTAGGTLPPSSASGCPCTETGAWSVSAGPAFVRAVISFSIPLVAALDGSHVHISNQANFADFDEAGPGTTGCTGSAAAPTAPSGHLCVYIGTETEALVPEEVAKVDNEVPGASTAGAYVQILLFSASAHASGTWAVTG
jgi:hypothetical protein